MYPKTLSNLIESFKLLPGIGEKTAERLAFAVLRFSEEECDKFSKNIENSKKNIHPCKKCGTLTDEEVMKKFDITKEKLKEIKKASINVLSLDQPVGEDEDTYLIDYVVDETSLNGGEFVNEIDKIEQENTVKLAMSKLKPRHQIILQQRLGLIDGEEKTLEEVGNIFGISRERVRQLEAKALNELRKPKNAKELKRIKN